MRLFTFSFDNNEWAISWIFTIFITLFFLVCLELFWRSNGHTTSVVDDRDLWSLERDRVGNSNRQVVLLGSSRIQADISIPTMSKLIPEYDIIHLGIDGSCAPSILEDLAADETFNGIVLCEIMAQCIMFGDYDELNAQDFSRYYHRIFSLDNKLNRIIATNMQENLIVIDPYLSFMRVSGYLVFKHEFPKPRYWKILRSRTEQVNYDLHPVENPSIRNLDRAKKHYKKLEDSITEKKFINKLNLLKKSVDQINSRGGKVVFVRFPVSDDHLALDEMYFPRTIYWDRFADTINSITIHFKDYPELDSFECPDTSHLDYRDTPRFTKNLISVMVQRGVF